MSWQIVSDNKIQISILILKRGALSRQKCHFNLKKLYPIMLKLVFSKSAGYISGQTFALCEVPGMSQSTIIRPMTCANDVGAWLWPTIAEQGLEVEWTEIGNITGCWWPARGTRRQVAACWVIWCPQSYVRRALSRWFLVRPRPSGATSSPALSGETICFSKTPPDTLSPLSFPPLQVVSWWVPPAPINTQIVKSGQIGLILQNLFRCLTH